MLYTSQKFRDAVTFMQKQMSNFIMKSIGKDLLYKNLALKPFFHITPLGGMVLSLIPIESRKIPILKQSLL